jgi:hypothetical protein
VIAIPCAYSLVRSPSRYLVSVFLFLNSIHSLQATAQCLSYASLSASQSLQRSFQTQSTRYIACIVAKESPAVNVFAQPPQCQREHRLSYKLPCTKPQTLAYRSSVQTARVAPAGSSTTLPAAPEKAESSTEISKPSPDSILRPSNQQQTSMIPTRCSACTRAQVISFPISAHPVECAIALLLDGCAQASISRGSRRHLQILGSRVNLPVMTAGVRHQRLERMQDELFRDVVRYGNFTSMLNGRTRVVTCDCSMTGHPLQVRPKSSQS